MIIPWQWADPDGDRLLDIQPSDLTGSAVNVCISASDLDRLVGPNLGLGVNLTRSDALELGLELVKMALTSEVEQ